MIGQDDLVRCKTVRIVKRQGPTHNIPVIIPLNDLPGHHHPAACQCFINAIVRPDLAQKEKSILIGSTLPGVYKVWPRHDNVCHLVASRMVNLDPILGSLPVSSRNSH